MNLINLDRKLIFDTLNRKILPHRFKLIQRIRIVVILFPSLFEELKGLLEDMEGADICWGRFLWCFSGMR